MESEKGGGVMVHYGWVIAAALAGFILGALIMSLMAVASRADDESERWWAE
jgi:purine-cytosine permease-like protein